MSRVRAITGTMKASQHNQQQPSGVCFRDMIIWVTITALLVAGFYANFHYHQTAVAIRLLAWLGLGALLLGLSLLTSKGQQMRAFAYEAKIELRKVVWPTRQTTVNTTMIVVVMVVLSSIVLWGIDTLMLHLISALTLQR